jgi:cold shock CspA family protein
LAFGIGMTRLGPHPAPKSFVHVHDVETAGMKTLVAGEVLVYNTAPARDCPLKAVNLRLL